MSKNNERTTLHSNGVEVRMKNRRVLLIEEEGVVRMISMRPLLSKDEDITIPTAITHTEKGIRYTATKFSEEVFTEVCIGYLEYIMSKNTRTFVYKHPPEDLFNPSNDKE